MPRGGQNRLPVLVKQSYFELIRTGMPGAEAARRVGVSMSCGSLWFIDAGSVSITETRPINPATSTKTIGSRSPTASLRANR